MKYRLMTVLLLMLCLLFSGAAAQTLPDLNVFSPGLTQMSEKLERGEQVEMTAELAVRDMLYARDLSLLQAMLDGMQLVYSGGGTLREGCDALKLIRSGETLFAADLVRNGLNAELSVNDRTFGLCLPEGFSGIAAAGDWISGEAILNRVPLISVCEAVEGLKAGEPLAAGFVVTAPFAVERTMSDDGTRLTKIHISSSVEREGEIWAVSGFLRQPAGRAPKDTAEITFARDEDNTLTATYSSTRSQSVSQKDKKGRDDYGEFWNLVEEKENRKNSQFARAIDLAYQSEFTPEQNRKVLERWIEKNWTSRGLSVDVSEHHGHVEEDGTSNSNDHAHLLIPTRKMDKTGWTTKDRESNDHTYWQEVIRRSWAEENNLMFDEIFIEKHKEEYDQIEKEIKNDYENQDELHREVLNRLYDEHPDEWIYISEKTLPEQREEVDLWLDEEEAKEKYDETAKQLGKSSECLSDDNIDIWLVDGRIVSMLKWNIIEDISY